MKGHVHAWSEQFSSESLFGNHDKYITVEVPCYNMLIVPTLAVDVKKFSRMFNAYFTIDGRKVANGIDTTLNPTKK